jgi:serine/threonine-protein kinase
VPDSDDVPTAAFTPPGDGDLCATRTGGTSPDAGPAVPPAVPGFEIEKELGRGGMGVVYLARQVKLNRPVALKMVLGGGHASAADLVRFAAEAEAGAAVPHAGVVQVYESGHHDGLPYFALEFCPGGSLAQRLAGTPMTAAAAAELVERLARAVQAAHEKGIVHRDLKPANVLFAADGTPKVADFGLARRAGSAAGLTATGAILGTPSYMSPEQAGGKTKEVGPPADVYALGAILYECLTGRPPFAAATPVETVIQVVADEPVPPSRLAPKTPRDLETICLKCLQKDPARRYASAAGLADDLGRFRDGRSILARPVPAWERAWKAARRRPAVAGSILALVLAAAAVFGVVAWKNAQLQKERDAARAAEEEAHAQEKLARGRLDTTLAAVDRMMVRVAGEQWAMNPALQQERKAVLEEAIAVYRGLLEGESKDPRVRRQAASAQMRVAGLYLFLADYPNCRKAAEAAAGLYRSLAAESPTDPAPVRGEAEAVGLLGHVATLTADSDGSKAGYERALELAERAVRLDPKSADSLLVLTACLTSLGHYHTARNPDRSTECFTRVLEIAAGLGTKPGAPFDHRLAHAEALVNVAAREIARRQSGPGAEKLNQAGGLFDQLARERPPDARSAESYARNRASWAVLQGQTLFLAGRRDDGLRLMAEAIDGFDRTLAVHPKSFPALMNRMQNSAAYSDMLRLAGKPAEARKALDGFARAQDALIREHPQMTWVNAVGAGHRSLWIVERVQTGECPDPQVEFDALLPAIPPPQVPLVRYNLACALAQWAKVGPADDRDNRAAKAVAVLSDLLAEPFFRNPANVAHLDKDTDLDPLRDRDDFKQFLQKAKAASAKKP